MRVLEERFVAAGHLCRRQNRWRCYREIVVLTAVNLPMLEIAPPIADELLLAIVLLMIVRIPVPLLAIPPPLDPAKFGEMLLLMIVSVPKLEIPPPKLDVPLLLMTQLLTVTVVTVDVVRVMRTAPPLVPLLPSPRPPSHRHAVEKESAERYPEETGIARLRSMIN